MKTYILFVLTISFLIIPLIACTNQFSKNTDITSNELSTFNTKNYTYQTPVIVDEDKKEILISGNTLVIPRGKTYTLLHGFINHISGSGNLVVQGDSMVHSVSIEGNVQLIHGQIKNIQANSVVLGGMVSQEFAYGPVVAGMIDAKDSVDIFNESTVQDIQCGGDISISSGTITGNMEAGKTITIGSNELDYFDTNANPVPIHIQGNITAAKQITVFSSPPQRAPTIDGTLSSNHVSLSGNAKIHEISPYSSDSILILDNFHGRLPEISAFHEIVLSNGSSISMPKCTTSFLTLNANTELLSDYLQITELLTAEASSQISTPAGNLYLTNVSGQTAWIPANSVTRGTILWTEKNPIHSKISTPGIRTALQQTENQTEVKVQNIQWFGIKMPKAIQINPNQLHSVEIETTPFATKLPEGYDIHLETYRQEGDKKIKISDGNFTAQKVDSVINFMAKDWNPNEEKNRGWVSCYVTDQNGGIIQNSQTWTEIQIIPPILPPSSWDLDTHEVSLISGKETYQFLVKNSSEPEQIQIQTSSKEHLSVSLIDKQDPRGTLYKITTKATDTYCAEYIKVIYQGKMSILKVNLYPSDGSITFKHKEYRMSPGDHYKIDAVIRDSKGEPLSIEQTNALISNYQLFVEDTQSGNVVDLQKLPNGNYEIMAKQVGSCKIVYQWNGHYDSIQTALTVHVEPDIQQYGSQEGHTTHLKYKNFL